MKEGTDLEELVEQFTARQVSVRLAAYRSLIQKCTGGGAMVKYNWCDYLSEKDSENVIHHIKTDLSSDSEESSYEAAGACGCLLASGSFVSMLKADSRKEIVEDLIKVVKEKRGKKVVVRTLWCISRSKFGRDVYQEKADTLLEAVCDILRSETSVSAALEALQVIHTLIEVIPDIIIKDIKIWFPISFRYVLHEADRVRSIVFIILHSVKLFLEDSGNKGELRNSVVSCLAAELHSKTCKKMIDLVNKDCIDILRGWRLIVLVLGPVLHKGTSLINDLLEVVEKGFKSTTPVVRVEAFRCWKALIDNFALDLDVLTHQKRLKLLLAPLKANNAKSEAIAHEKLLVWWHLVIRLKKHAASQFDTVVLPLLKFCFSGTSSSSPGGQNIGLAQRNLMMSVAASPGRKYPGLLFLCAEMIAQMLSAGINIPERQPFVFSISPLEEPLVNEALFFRTLQLLFSCVGEVLNSFNDESEDDKRKNRQSALVTLIIQSLVTRVLRAVKSEGNKKESVEQVKEMFTLFSELEHSCKPGAPLSDFVFKFYEIITTSQELALPLSVINSRQYNITGNSMQDMMSGTLSNHIIQQLCKPSLLHLATKKEEYFTVWITVLDNSKPSTGKLGFLQSIVKEIEGAEASFGSSHPDTLRRMWAATVRQLLSFIEQTQIIDQGDGMEHDWICIYNMLLFPVNQSVAGFKDTNEEFYQKVMVDWSELWFKFTELTPLATTAEPNSEVEYIARGIINVYKRVIAVSSVEGYGSAYNLMANILLLLTQKVRYSELGKASLRQVNSPAKPKKKSHPLCNLSGCVELFELLFKGLMRMGACPGRISTAQLLCESIINIFRGIHQEKLLNPLIAEVLPTITEGFKISPFIRFNADVGKQFVKVVRSFSLMFEEHIGSAHTTDHVNKLEPLLRLTLTSNTKEIKQAGRQLWKSSFSNTSCSIPSALYEVLKDCSLPPACLNDSQDDFEEFSTNPKENVPDNVMAGSFLKRAGGIDSTKKYDSPKSKYDSPKSKFDSPKVSRLSLGTPKTNEKKRIGLQEMKEADFVKVSSPKPSRRVLTEHQIEKFKERRDIPALYSDLSQSASQIILPTQFASQHSFEESILSEATNSKKLLPENENTSSKQLTFTGFLSPDKKDDKIDKTNSPSVMGKRSTQIQKPLDKGMAKNSEKSIGSEEPKGDAESSEKSIGSEEEPKNSEKSIGSEEPKGDAESSVKSIGSEEEPKSSEKSIGSEEPKGKAKSSEKSIRSEEPKGKAKSSEKSIGSEEEPKSKAESSEKSIGSEELKDKAKSSEKSIGSEELKGKAKSSEKSIGSEEPKGKAKSSEKSTGSEEPKGEAKSSEKSIGSEEEPKSKAESSEKSIGSEEPKGKAKSSEKSIGSEELREEEVEIQDGKDGDGSANSTKVSNVDNEDFNESVIDGSILQNQSDSIHNESDISDSEVSIKMTRSQLRNLKEANTKSSKVSKVQRNVNANKKSSQEVGVAVARGDIKLSKMKENIVSPAENPVMEGGPRLRSLRNQGYTRRDSLDKTNISGTPKSQSSAKKNNSTPRTIVSGVRTRRSRGSVEFEYLEFFEKDTKDKKKSVNEVSAKNKITAKKEDKKISEPSITKCAGNDSIPVPVISGGTESKKILEVASVEVLDNISGILVDCDKANSLTHKETVSEEDETDRNGRTPPPSLKKGKEDYTDIVDLETPGDKILSGTVKSSTGETSKVKQDSNCDRDYTDEEFRKTSIVSQMSLKDSPVDHAFDVQSVSDSNRRKSQTPSKKSVEDVRKVLKGRVFVPKSPSESSPLKNKPELIKSLSDPHVNKSGVSVSKQTLLKEVDKSPEVYPVIKQGVKPGVCTEKDVLSDTESEEPIPSSQDDDESLTDMAQKITMSRLCKSENTVKDQSDIVLESEESTKETSDQVDRKSKRKRSLNDETEEDERKLKRKKTAAMERENSGDDSLYIIEASVDSTGKCKTATPQKEGSESEKSDRPGMRSSNSNFTTFNNQNSCDLFEADTSLTTPPKVTRSGRKIVAPKKDMPEPITPPGCSSGKKRKALEDTIESPKTTVSPSLLSNNHDFEGGPESETVSQVGNSSLEKTGLSNVDLETVAKRNVQKKITDMFSKESKEPVKGKATLPEMDKLENDLLEKGNTSVSDSKKNYGSTNDSDVIGSKTSVKDTSEEENHDKNVEDELFIEDSAVNEKMELGDKVSDKSPVINERISKRKSEEMTRGNSLSPLKNTLSPLKKRIFRDAGSLELLSSNTENNQKTVEMVTSVPESIDLEEFSSSITSPTTKSGKVLSPKKKWAQSAKGTEMAASRIEENEMSSDDVSKEKNTDVEKNLSSKPDSSIKENGSEQTGDELVILDDERHQPNLKSIISPQKTSAKLVGSPHKISEKSVESDDDSDMEVDVEMIDQEQPEKSIMVSFKPRETSESTQACIAEEGVIDISSPSSSVSPETRDKSEKTVVLSKDSEKVPNIEADPEHIILSSNESKDGSDETSKGNSKSSDSSSLENAQRIDEELKEVDRKSIKSPKKDKVFKINAEEKQSEEESSPEKPSPSKFTHTLGTPERQKKFDSMKYAGSRAAMLVACAKQNIKNRSNEGDSPSKSTVGDAVKNRPGHSPVRRSSAISVSPSGSPPTSSCKRKSQEAENAKPWVKHEPSLGATPSPSILKKSGVEETVGRDTTSPPSKQRRVSFADPPVSDRVEIPPSPKTLKSMRAQKRLDMTKADSPAKAPSSELEESQPYPDSPLNVNCSQPLYSPLIDCKDPVDRVALDLTSPFLFDGLKMVLDERGIQTVGQFCRLTEADIKQLPIREPKVSSALKVLKKYKETRLTNKKGTDVLLENVENQLSEIFDGEGEVRVDNHLNRKRTNKTEESGILLHSGLENEDLPIEDGITPLESTVEDVSCETINTFCKQLSENPQLLDVLVENLDENARQALLQRILVELPYGAVLDTYFEYLRKKDPSSSCR